MGNSLLEKLKGFRLVKKFPAFYETRKFITAVTSACKLSLSWASSIQSVPPHPTSWRYILILSSHLRLGFPSGLFPSGFSTKALYSSPQPNMRYMPRSYTHLNRLFNSYQSRRNTHAHTHTHTHTHTWKRWRLLKVSTIIHQFIYLLLSCVGRDRSVAIRTRYGLDGPGIESWWRRDFPHLSRPDLRPTQPPVQWVPGISRG
jgi:hypothetical protein